MQFVGECIVWLSSDQTSTSLTPGDVRQLDNFFSKLKV